MWPSPAQPALGAFVERQVRALERLVAAATSAARRSRPEVVVGHFLFPGGEAARRAARAAGVPYAVVAHGQDVVNAETSGWLRRVTTRALADAGLLVAVSQPLADRLGARSEERRV